MRSLGASKAFDYNSSTVVQDIIQLYKSGNKVSAGALSISQDAATRCIDVLSKVNGKKFVSMAAYPTLDKLPKHFAFFAQIFAFLSGMLKVWLRSKMRGVKFGMIFGGSLVDNGVGKAVFGEYLEQALASQEFKPCPEPLVVGQGLDALQGAMDKQKKGVSAKKIVVTLP